MNVGDYVRTKYGIRKVIQIDNETTSKIRCYVLDKFYNECTICSSNYIYDEDIIKSAEGTPKGLLSLIEVGDYVNGRIVEWVADDFVAFGKLDYAYKKDIKSIVTREQFLQMEYKIESEVN